MAIKKLNRDPNPSDLTQQDILINSKDGGLFYKTENNILNKIPGSSDPVINNSVSVTKHFQLVNFALDFKHHSFEKAISFKSINENATLHADDCYLFPFGGEIHSLYFKIAGLAPRIKVKAYSNIADLDRAYGMSVDAIDTSLGSLPTQLTGVNMFNKTITPQAGQGDGVGFKTNMTIINLNIKYDIGTHAVITLKKDDSNSATTSKSINEIFGQMLVSHNITV